MNLRTFSAPSMAQALVQVKNEMGTDALILHTRTYHRRRWMGLRRQEIVEITAGNGLNLTPRNQRRRTAPSTPAAGVQVQAAQPAATPAGGGPGGAITYGPGSRPRPALAGAVLGPAAGLSDSTAGGAAVATAGGIADGRRAFLDSPAAGNAMMVGLSNEVGSLKKLVGELVTETRLSHAPQVPEDLFDYYLTMIQHEVAEEVAADVLKSLKAQLRPEQLKQPEYVREKLAEHLERLMPVSGPIVRKKTKGPHVVALIGPTGVGKTTTIAKLAANLKLREGHSVGLVTIDTYRLAAVDQIKKYADIIGSPLHVVNTPEELREAVEAMADCEFVLIDTAGRSPTDTLKLNELKNFLAAAEPDEVHLVVSTTQSQACIERAIERFQNVRVDKIIFTKFDEAVHIGVVLNVVRKVNKSLSYVTTGQNVPDDIEVSRGRRLAQRILGTDP